MAEAVAPEGLRQQTFYHGTSDDAKGQSILQNGIVPGNQSGHARGHLTPVVGRSYLTTNLVYGIIYCIGGNMLGDKDVEHLIGHNRHGNGSRYGWLFVIDGDHLLDDVQPDEDSVGEFLGTHTETGWDQSSRPWRRLPPTYKPDGVEDEIKRNVWHNIRHSMTDRQFRSAAEGYISAQAAGGKRALKYLSDHDKLALIRWGAHVAYRGTLVPDQAWRFDKMDNPQLAKDGSNFFALAKQVK